MVSCRSIGIKDQIFLLIWVRGSSRKADSLCIFARRMPGWTDAVALSASSMLATLVAPRTPSSHMITTSFRSSRPPATPTASQMEDIRAAETFAALPSPYPLYASRTPSRLKSMAPVTSALFTCPSTSISVRWRSITVA
ncbi:hypothetical protein PMAYCL1PPCAC_28412, partial [Pristionchus mayeri]